MEQQQEINERRKEADENQGFNRTINCFCSMLAQPAREEGKSEKNWSAERTTISSSRSNEGAWSTDQDSEGQTSWEIQHHLQESNETAINPLNADFLMKQKKL